MTRAFRKLCASEPDYPAEVEAMARPPRTLYIRGPLPQQPGVAIVGTRAATAPAMAYARRLAAHLAQSGLAIWSGGATGIDTAAHQGALEAGGVTVVVMGTGFDVLYPAENRELFERVARAGGCWLSPFAPHQTGARWTFLLRNELMASMVMGAVVVQAPVRSGARSTAAACRRMGKPVWAVPAWPWDSDGAGCLAELAAGAQVLHSPDQVIARCGGHPRPKTPRPAQALNDQERAVVEAVQAGCGHRDQVCEHTGLSASEVAAVVFTLTLRLVLLESPNGQLQIVKT